MIGHRTVSGHVALLCCAMLTSCADDRSGGTGSGAETPEVTSVRPALDFGEDRGIYITPQAVTALMTGQIPTSWEPTVNTEKAHGGEGTYRAVAPAVVVVRTEYGHGTGFLIEPTGLVLTNHHVVASVHLGVRRLS